MCSITRSMTSPGAQKPRQEAHSSTQIPPRLRGESAALRHAGHERLPVRVGIGCGSNAIPQATQYRALSGFRAKHSGQTGPDGAGRLTISAWQYAQAVSASPTNAPHAEHRVTAASLAAGGVAVNVAPHRHVTVGLVTFSTSY